MRDCRITPGVGPVDPIGRVVVTPRGTTTYELRCLDAFGVPIVDELTVVVL